MKYLKLFTVPALINFLRPIVAFAQTDPPTSPTEGFDKAADLIKTIANVLATIQDLMLKAGGGIVVMMIIIGGIQYIMNQKDAGKKTITAAIIGAAIVLLSVSIVAFVKIQLEPITNR